MKERPILFSGPMVRAILSGAKTQTRRIVKGGPEFHSRAALHSTEDGLATFGDSIPDDPVPIQKRCPYGVPGDRLWVREVHAFLAEYDKRKAAEVSEVNRRLVWRAVDEEKPSVGRVGSWVVKRGRWRPSIHMPHWASRLTLEVTEVRVERLWKITEVDARAEGITDGGCVNCGRPEPCGCEDPKPDARDAFCELWDTINAKRAPWDSDPWVWVVGFRRVAS